LANELDNLGYPPLDESQDRELRIQTANPDPPGPEIAPDDPYEAANLPPPVIPATPAPWAPNNLKSNYIVGAGDCYMGKVLHSYDDAADATLGQKGAIDVRRVTSYGTGDSIELGEIEPPLSSPNAGLAAALPLPAVDQEGYLAAADDPVLVIAGRDGRAYYMPDSKPFIGVVAQNPDDESTKETNFGGAGNITLKVTRQIMSGDPTAEAPAFEDTAVTYDYVFPLTADGQHHGYRKDDKVLVFRRGMYMFCLPGRTSFHGKIAAAGPDSEADLTDDRYWVALRAGNVTYTGDVNVWTWGTDAALFTICASNLPERAGGTHLLAADTEVVVSLFADATSADKSAYWVFSVIPDTDERVGVTAADTIPGYLRWTNGDDGAHHKIIGDSEVQFGAAAAHGHWIVATPGNAGGDEQLRIDHVGPGTPYYVIGPSSPGQNGTFAVTDILGHVAGWYDYDFCADTWTWNAGSWGYDDPLLGGV